MLRRSLAAVIALGLLLFGATVSLEALGLLFHAAVPDLQQRVEAFVARLAAEVADAVEPDRHNARVAAAFSSTMPDLRPETATEPEEGVAPAPVEPREPAAVPAP